MTCLPIVAPIRRIRASVVGVLFLVVLAGTVPAGDSPFSMPKLVDGGIDGPVKIAVGDLDGDGDSDIASISTFDGLVSWYENQGTVPATFGARRGVATVSASRSVAIADINGDGRLDIVAGTVHAAYWYANRGGTPPAFELHNLTSLEGVFQTPTLIEGEVHAADFNNDGHTDLLSIDDNRMAWHRNNGADPPVFTRLFLDGSTGSSVNTAAAGDLDGDGDLDIVSLWTNGSKVVVHDNDGSEPSGFTRREISEDPAWPCLDCPRGTGVIFSPRSARVADLDADGDMDFITASYEGNRIHWWDNDGAQPPGFVPRTIFSTGNNSFGSNAAVPADVDGDGDLDVLVANAVTHSIEWFENDGSPAVGFWARHGVDDALDSPVALEPVDLDDDGDTDLVAADILGDRVVWYTNKTVAVDVSAPLIAPVVTGQAGNNGWYRSNTFVAWSVEEDESLIISSSGCDVSGITDNTPGVTITCTATSVGGTASASITVRRDSSAPVITFDPAVPLPNANGWNNTDVTVPFTVVDQLSGVDTIEPASPLVFTLEGIRTLSVSATDAAGNIRSASSTVQIDKTAPVINANRVPAPNASGWNNTDATVDFSCTDSRSGLAAGSPPPDVTVSAEVAGQSVSGQCEDRAGNVSSVTTIVNLDRTAPTTSALPDRQPDSAGWYNHPVTITWSGVDNLSGIAQCSDPATYAGPDAAAVVRTGACTDRAGNVGEAAMAIAFDATPPLVMIDQPAGGAVYLLNQQVPARYSCSDATSGVASCAGAVPIGSNIDTTQPGTHLFGVTAFDRAGNRTLETRPYVVGYAFSGFLSPVEDPPVVNVVRPGRIIPIRWRLSDAFGAPISSLASFGSLTSSPVACEAAPETEVGDDAVSTGGMLLRFDPPSGQYIYQWETSSSWTGCRVLQLTLTDGSHYLARFSFR